MYQIETPDKLFHDGNGTSELGTILPAWWLNQMQGELLGILEAAGVAPNKNNNKQVRAALQKMFDEKLGNGGSQTLNGTLTVNNTAWSKAEFPNPDGSKWRLEFNPKGDAEKSLNFNHVAPNNTQTYIWFPKVSENQNVAYQSWVNQQINAKGSEKVNVKAAEHNGDYSQSGFYRANGAAVDNKTLPKMEIHIAHPTAGGNKYGRGIGFGYGGDFDLTTTSWDGNGNYLGQKAILTEDNGVMLSGAQTIAGSKTFSDTAAFAKDINISKSGQAATGVVGAWADYIFVKNNTANKWLALKDNGDLLYGGGKIYHEGNKPAWADIQAKPDIATRGTTLQHYGITDAVNTADFNWAKVPPGTVAYFAAENAPHGWLVANGAAVSRSSFAALFAAIGTRHGAGNGSTTFNVPDLRGEFVRGWDAGRGADSGRALGSGQEQNTQDHWHGIGKISDNEDNAELINRNWGAGYNGAARVVFGEGNRAVSTAISGGNLGTGAAIEHSGETRPRNVALLACIKA